MSRREIFTSVAAAPVAIAAVGIGIENASAASSQSASPREPITWQLLEAYKTWLNFELMQLCWEMAEHPAHADHYLHYPNGSERKGRYEAISRSFSFIGQSGSFHFGEQENPSTRAAAVLTAVGCDWHDPDYDDIENDMERP